MYENIDHRGLVGQKCPPVDVLCAFITVGRKVVALKNFPINLTLSMSSLQKTIHTPDGARSRPFII